MELSYNSPLGNDKAVYVPPKPVAWKGFLGAVTAGLGLIGTSALFPFLPFLTSLYNYG